MRTRRGTRASSRRGRSGWASGAPRPRSAATSIAAIPSSETVDAPCVLPAGLFWHAGAGFHANGIGHYCVFTSWASYKAAGGPDATSTLPDYTPVPSSELFDGPCS